MTNNHDKLPISRFPKMRAAAASLLFLLLRFTHRLNFFLPIRNYLLFEINLVIRILEVHVKVDFDGIVK